MKEIASIASNLMLIPLANGQVQASAELIILTSEPSYNIRGKEVEQDRPLEAVRVCVDLKAVGGMIQALQNLGEELEKMQAEYNAKLPSKPVDRAFLVYGKNVAGKFDAWRDHDDGMARGIGTFDSATDAKAHIEKAYPNCTVDTPLPLNENEDGIMVFKVTPK